LLHSENVTQLFLRTQIWEPEICLSNEFSCTGMVPYFEIFFFCKSKWGNYKYLIFYNKSFWDCCFALNQLLTFFGKYESKNTFFLTNYVVLDDCFTVFCSALLCFALLRFTLFYFALLCFHLFYFALLCFALLYFALLYFTLLYFALLCFTMLYFACSALLYFALIYFTLLYILYVTLLCFSLL